MIPNLDLSRINEADFKEDSVREAIIMPILLALGYSDSSDAEFMIQRSVKLLDPWVKTGSRAIEIAPVFPDYLLRHQGRGFLILEAKSPWVNIHEGEPIHQAFFYAIHPEIRVNHFALCNGHHLTIFNIYREMLESIPLAEIDQHWQRLQDYFKPPAKAPVVSQPPTREKNYLDREQPRANLPDHKQRLKRHYGVHPYFTRQVGMVVSEYIRRFSDPDDLILDSFGGSGITVVEAMMLGRRAIQIDLNPLCKLIVEGLTLPVEIQDLLQEIERIAKSYPKQLEKILKLNDSQVDQELSKFYPADLDLPKGSDVPTVRGLFSRQQIVELALLKKIILASKKKATRKSLMVSFSSTVNKINLTFHRGTKTPNGGDSGPMRYYRYRIAKTPTQLDTLKTFLSKADRLVKAKLEMQGKINDQTIDRLHIIQGDATRLTMIDTESVDYIYTDPPYGKKIPYLDLSIMWNSWLDLPVTADDLAREAIEGGTHFKQKEEYGDLIIESLKEMFRVLKWNRWMSFVFQHQDPYFWYLIVNNAEKIGFEYAGMVRQDNGQTSYKKRQNPFRVLSGQMIINFKKVQNPLVRQTVDLGTDFKPLLLNHIESIIAKYQGATMEEFYADLITVGTEFGYLDWLHRNEGELLDIINQGYEFDPKTEKYNLKPNQGFKTHIPTEERVGYFIRNCLMKHQRQNSYPSLETIVSEVMPYLKNGTTPTDQTIIRVLGQVADRYGRDGWQIKGNNRLI
ncbi:MAG: DNA methyltransferase [Candidatus Pacebacteria bacterium]|nr:DNA methyltransferase [Candidatus Paceibacterota bacterium]